MEPARLDPARFDPDAFLRDHWQTTPLLLRDPWPGWTNPLEPDELAGLACEEGVESRLITTSSAEPRLEHGPFDADRLGRLGATPWTLLVQGVDRHDPAVVDLLSAFRFLPDWRVDDVMVSLAGDGGGVGPHVDQYDVFLIQGLGRRRWRIGAPLGEQADGPEGPLRLLPGFATTDEWELGPGDILYLPPGVPHDGVAVGGDCMTYSVGFRAPLASELLSGWADEALERLDVAGTDRRHTDPGLARQANPGEITGAALDSLYELMKHAVADRDGFAHWYGRHSTEPRDAEIDWSPDEPTDLGELRERLAGGERPIRNPAHRFAFVRGTSGVTLFVDGEAHECADDRAEVAEALCAYPEPTLPVPADGRGAGAAHPPVRQRQPGVRRGLALPPRPRR